MASLGPNDLIALFSDSLWWDRKWLHVASKLSNDRVTECKHVLQKSDNKAGWLTDLFFYTHYIHRCHMETEKNRASYLRWYYHCLKIVFWFKFDWNFVIRIQMTMGDQWYLKRFHSISSIWLIALSEKAMFSLASSQSKILWFRWIVRRCYFKHVIAWNDLVNISKPSHYSFLLPRVNNLWPINYLHQVSVKRNFWTKSCVASHSRWHDPNVTSL